MADDATALLKTALTYRDVLESLDSAPKTKPELVDECDVSRSTIDRWLRDLQGDDLVRRPADRFDLTLFGRLVTREQARVQARFDQLVDVCDPLTSLSSETDIDPRVFENAEMESYTGGGPQLGEELLTHPGRVKLVAPDVASIYSLFLYDDPNPDLELEAVLDRGMVSRLEEFCLNQRMTLLGELDVDVYELDDPPSFCLALLEREERSTVHLIFGSVDTPVGVVKNASPDAVAWGEAMYRTYREGATEREWPDLDQPLDILREGPRRHILMELMNGRVEHDTDVMHRKRTGEDGSSIQHDHLSKLEEADYIEWDGETGSIAKGPKFEEIEPLLKLIETHTKEVLT
jgi:hypothetical protein